MGCASSSQPEDPQAMHERQRQIMLQRQREFEQRRQGISDGKGQAQAGLPVRSISGTPAGHKVGDGKRDSSKGDSASTIRKADSKESISSVASAKPASADKPAQRTSPRAIEKKSPQETESPSRDMPEPDIIVSGNRNSAKKHSNLGEDGDGSGSDTEKLASKYTIAKDDLGARRSKNVHDLAMYGKDVTRRASFNPRPKESPFTPEMQAMMKLGHEALVAAETEKKVQRLRQGTMEEVHMAQPEFEDADNAKSEANETGSSDNVENDHESEEKQEDGDEAKKRGGDDSFSVAPDQAERLPVVSENRQEDPQVAKFLARDNVDRKSKNIHDLGQYMGKTKDFSRRASYVPPPSSGGLL